MINTASYSFASQAYPEQLEKIIALMEATLGVGMMMGPVLGSFVYDTFGFEWTFLIFGLFMVPVALIVTFVLPKPSDIRLSNKSQQQLSCNIDSGSLLRGTQLESVPEEDEEESERLIKKSASQSQVGGEEPEKLSYRKLACLPRVLFPPIAGMISYLIFCSQEPILSLRFVDYDITQIQQGLIFGINPMMYTVNTILIPYTVPTWVEKRLTMIIGLFLCAIFTTLIGPFFAETNLTAMVFGLALSGFFFAYLTIPNMPEMYQATQ